MSRFSRLRERFGLDRRARGRLARDIDDEIAFHLESRVDGLVRQGLDRKAARARALREFGDVRRCRARLLALDEGRAAAVSHRHALDALGQDFAFALRQLKSNRSFAAAAVLTLALGIGATTVIFSVVNAVLLRPLPFVDPDRLVRLYEITPQGRQYTTSEPTLLDWQRTARGFDGVAGYTFTSMTLTGAGEPEALTGGRISWNLLPLLGIDLTLGRWFTGAEDDVLGDRQVIVLDEGPWRRRFGADPDLVGRGVTLDGRSFTVVGVARLEAVELLDTEVLDFLVPLAADPEASRSNHYITAVARLADGVSLRDAQAEMTRIAGELGEDHPASNAGWDARVVPLRDWMIDAPLKRRLAVLLGAVGLVLLLACANVSNLLLARGESRARELATRAALGASRARLIGLLLTESLVLAGLGTAAGLALAAAAMPVVGALGPADVPRLGEVAVDGTVLAFAAAAAIVTALAVGLVPAFRGARRDVELALREGGRAVAAGGRLRGALVVSELALAMLVLVAAALLARSFLNLQAVDPGFDPEHAYTARLQLPSSTPDGECVAFFERLEERLRALPGVVSVGSAFIEPFSHTHTSNRVAATSALPQAPDDFLAIDWRTVTPDFWKTTRIPLVRGRWLTERDGGPPAPGRPVPVVVSRSLARALWGDGDPIGRTLLWSGPEGPVREVVGVVGDVRDYALESELPTLYYVHHAVPWNAMTVVVRVEEPASAVLPAIRREIRNAAPDLPIPAVLPLAATLGRAVAAPRFLLQLFGVFAALALVLGAMGVYAVTLVGVNQRTREIGIRMALGAAPDGILRLILGQSLARTLVGLGLGLAGAVALTRAMRAMLYEVGPFDPLSYAVVAAVLLIAATLATVVPGLRAARVDPRVAFSAE